MITIDHFIGLNLQTEIEIYVKKQFQVPTVKLTKSLTDNWFCYLFLIYFRTLTWSLGIPEVVQYHHELHRVSTGFN